eukprot:gene27729-34496_t
MTVPEPNPPPPAPTLHHAFTPAELIAHAPQGVTPGQPLWLGLQITHQPDWHTYWRNPGDSGHATSLTKIRFDDIALARLALQ